MPETAIDYKKREEQQLVGKFNGLQLVCHLAWPLAVAIFLLIAMNFIIFRLCNYYYWVKPDSTMGTAEQGEGLVSHQIVPGAKNVIVIGDSRVSEGFSAVNANLSSGRRDVNFVQAGMPGTEPRVWYYFLRKIDPNLNKFSAIVLMAPRFDDDHQAYDAAARTDDLTYLQPLTTYKDAFDVALSYPGLDDKIHALAGMLLPIATARLDLLDFAAAPRKRRFDARLWHDHFYEWSLGYKGASGHVPDVRRDELASFDFAGAGLPPVKVVAMQGYVQHVLGKQPVISANQVTQYRLRWYGAIADEYGRVGIPVFVFQAPRGPYEQFLSDSDTGGGALRELAANGKLTLLDPSPIDALEQPKYFFDSLHVNETGRELLTPILAHLVTQKLPVGR
ncbi:hypothetical protein P3T42_002747 [Paraburkholderia sp. GAS38]|uniref:hypothetical protein n=1 Tax=Paraburkholderia sp. GAS38 TaxID=3035133 RepID=UPI003D22DC75